MRSLILVPCLLMTFTAAADESLTVLKAGPDGGSPRTMLSRYLNAQAGKAFEARRAAVAALKTPDDLARRQRELKGKFLEALGDLPEKTPLNPRVVGTDRARRLPRRTGHLREPARPPRHGPVLPPRRDAAVPRRAHPLRPQRQRQGAASYQRACILLAKNGMAALCYDPIGQGERMQLLDGEGKPMGHGSTTEHTMAGIGALLVGRSTAGYRIWDGIRSLDYLASRPEIDAAPARLHRQLGRRHADVVPDGPRRPDRRRGAVVLHHLARAALRHDRARRTPSRTSPARSPSAWTTPTTSRCARPGRPCSARRRATSSTSRGPGPPSARRSGSTACSATPSGSTSSSRTRRTASQAAAARRCSAGCAAGCRGWTTPRPRARSPSPPTPSCNARETGQVLSDLHGKSVFDLNAERATELARRRSEFQAKHGKAGLLARSPPPDRPARPDRAGQARRSGRDQAGWQHRAQAGLHDRAGDRGAGAALHAREGRRVRAADCRGRLRHDGGDRAGGTGRGPAQARAAVPGRRPARDGRDGPRGGQARSASAPTCRKRSSRSTSAAPCSASGSATCSP